MEEKGNGIGVLGIVIRGIEGCPFQFLTGGGGGGTTLRQVGLAIRQDPRDRASHTQSQCIQDTTWNII